jgi:glycogen(starch) synthase
VSMRILFCSHAFAPSMGGLETVGKLLVEGFTRSGAEVTVVTATPGPEYAAPYRIIRNPGVRMLRGLAHKSDIIVQSNISLRTLIPLMPFRRPVVVIHHGVICRNDETRGVRDYLKLSILRLCHNVAVSDAVAATLPVKSLVCGNPFDATEFSFNTTEKCRNKDLVFLGRLVDQKGAEDLLRALALLKAEEFCPTLTVVGDGPELELLKRVAIETGIAEQVTFAGSIRDGRGRLIAEHKIMVIPSRKREGFGVVALEGIASGCAIVASDSGGLPEAVGQCGLVFPQGDVRALAGAIKKLLSNADLREQLRSHAQQHLLKFDHDVLSQRYLQLFNTILGRDNVAVSVASFQASDAIDK